MNSNDARDVGALAETIRETAELHGADGALFLQDLQEAVERLPGASVSFLSRCLVDWQTEGPGLPQDRQNGLLSAAEEFRARDVHLDIVEEDILRALDNSCPTDAGVDGIELTLH